NIMHSGHWPLATSLFVAGAGLSATGSLSKTQGANAPRSPSQEALAGLNRRPDNAFMTDFVEQKRAALAKHLRGHIQGEIRFDPASRRVRIQPGVVLDQLNNALAAHGLQFGPDVATASRANLGGMVGNNSAGARSIVYGKTIDHVRRLTVVLSDGNSAEFSPVNAEEWDRWTSVKSLQGSL